MKIKKWFIEIDGRDIFNGTVHCRGPVFMSNVLCYPV